MTEQENHGKTVKHDYIIIEVIYTFKLLSIKTISLVKLQCESNFSWAFSYKFYNSNENISLW